MGTNNDYQNHFGVALFRLEILNFDQIEVVKGHKYGS